MDPIRGFMGTVQDSYSEWISSEIDPTSQAPDIVVEKTDATKSCLLDPVKATSSKISGVSKFLKSYVLDVALTIALVVIGYDMSQQNDHDDDLTNSSSLQQTQHRLVNTLKDKEAKGSDSMIVNHT